jgi:hypothetical protein
MATKEELIASAIANLTELSTVELDITAYANGYEAGYRECARIASEASALTYTNTASAFIDVLFTHINSIVDTATKNPEDISEKMYGYILTNLAQLKADYIYSLTTP